MAIQQKDKKNVSVPYPQGISTIFWQHFTVFNHYRKAAEDD